MNYKLAKQLKDAGFPQNKDNPTLHTPGCNGWDKQPDGLVCTKESRPCVPTLEELIEACGDNTVVLHSYSKRLHLDSEDGAYALCNGKEGRGSKPTEAVARLWLALQKNK